MPWTIVGMDEAGYGPTLGPLCVGMAAFRLRDADAAVGPPDLWKILGTGVCREPGRGGRHDAKGRVAVADSKALKLPNDCKSAHPLVHLERGVLAFAGLLGPAAIKTDVELLLAVGGGGQGLHRCYGGEAVLLPVGISAGEVSIASNLLRPALDRAGVELLALRVIVIGEGDYNSIIRETGNKAETTAWAIGKHVRSAWEQWGLESPGERLGVVCDRLGGRAAYADLLGREVPGIAVDTVEEGPLRSRYVMRSTQGPARRAGAAYLVDGETAHLPIALASMAAKYIRELLMGRFNTYWGGLHRDLTGREIKPTAGYATDARRWLGEIGEDVMGKPDREHLIRVA